MLGHDGKPLKSILKRTKVVSTQQLDVILKSSTNKEDMLVANMDGASKNVPCEGSFASSAATYVHFNAATVVDNSSSEQETFIVQDVVENNKKTTEDTGLPKSVTDSFANLFKPEQTSKKLNFCSLSNEEKIENSDVVLLKHATDKVMSRYENTLVGYFMGKTIASTVVENYVKNTWSKFGVQKVMKTDNGVFLFKFSSLTGLEQKGEVTKVPVWVKLHGVPVLAYSDVGLSLIATQIGKPIMLDAFTSLMCVESWGRISFTRALIEVSAKSSLKTEVVMAIPNDEDDGHTKEVIRVEYEWTPPHCVDCKNFGHSIKQCPKCVIEAAPSASSSAASHVNKKEEGFVETSSSKNTKVPSPVKSDLNTPLSNTFDVLNTVEEDVGDSNVKGVDPVDGADFQNQNVSKPIGNGSPKKDDEDESDEDEVFMPGDNYTTSGGGGFSMEDDDLDCFDGYEAQGLEVGSIRHIQWIGYGVLEFLEHGYAVSSLMDTAYWSSE
ncbi:putative reverse transcriptase domain, reverse transcriptase zinc-binding domain protein [Tanacetum coccineum]